LILYEVVYSAIPPRDERAISVQDELEPGFPHWAVGPDEGRNVVVATKKVGCSGFVRYAETLPGWVPVPPTAGCEWQLEHELLLNRGPRPSLAATTSCSSWNWPSPFMKKSNAPGAESGRERLIPVNRDTPHSGIARRRLGDHGARQARNPETSNPEVRRVSEGDSEPHTFPSHAHATCRA
jgi:hypothetical protein